MGYGYEINEEKKTNKEKNRKRIQFPLELEWYIVV